MDARPLGSSVDFSQQHDVLVAGSGGGGVAGAYTAAREGLDVLLIEATDKFGGTTAYSGGGGVWFPCNPVLVRAGTDDTIEDALTYYRAVVGDRTPRELQETFVRGGAPLIEYLEQDANLKFVPLPWPDYYGKAPKGKEGRPAAHRGQAAQGGRRAGVARCHPRAAGHRPARCGDAARL